MTDANPVRLARGVQHLLPVVLLAVAFLELSALIPVPFDTLDVGGVAALLGPASFLPLSLAVVWAAFLPPTRTGLLVKIVTAVGAAGFVAARIVLTVAWWMEQSGAGAGWTTTVLGLSGLLLGSSLLVWSVVDVSATRSALRRPRDEVSPALAAAPVDPVLPASPSTPARPPSPVRVGPQPPHPSQETPSPMWQSVSTPWPRRDESDPNGTLIRPPRPQRPRH